MIRFSDTGFSLSLFSLFKTAADAPIRSLRTGAPPFYGSGMAAKYRVRYRINRSRAGWGVRSGLARI